MLSPEQLGAFLVAALLITASPGPDNLMVLSLGMSRGRPQGMVFGLGCALGCLSHTLLALVGVSAAIAASPWAFTVLRLGGGAYLVWLGLRALRSRSAVRVQASGDVAGTLRGLFWQGVLANAINPKVVLFFLSFLPQFVQPARGAVGLQLALLGGVFTVQAAVLFGLLGYFSGHVGQWLNRSPHTGPWLDRLAGVVFVALGLRLIVAR